MTELKFTDLPTVQKTFAALCNPTCNLIIKAILSERKNGIEFLSIGEVATKAGISGSLAQHHTSNMTALGLLERRVDGNKTLVKVADFHTWGDLQIAFVNMALIIDRRAAISGAGKPTNDGK